MAKSIESTLHGLDKLIEGVNFDSLKRNPTRNGVHILELKHVFFNKSQFAPHGKDQFIKWLIEQRGYSDAEAIVSMEEVYDRGQNVLNKAKGESKEPITGWTIDDEEEEGESGDWIGFWIRDMIGSNSLHKRDDKTWRDLEKMGKREGVHVTRADFDEYLNNTAYEYLDGHGWRDLWKDWVGVKGAKGINSDDARAKSDWYSYAVSEGLTRAEAKVVWEDQTDSFGETGTETHYKYQRRHYIKIGNTLKNLPKDQKQQEFKKWDEIFRADNERYDSQRFADHIGLFEVDSVTETLHALDKLIESSRHRELEDELEALKLLHQKRVNQSKAQGWGIQDSLVEKRIAYLQKKLGHEVLQSASGSLSPQKRNKAIRALQSIPRGQALGQSDVIPNVDTALEQLDNLIEAKELKQQIGEALVQIKEALRPMPDAGRSGYNKFGHQGFRKEWSELLKVYEDLLNKCQAKTGMGRTIGTRPAKLNTEKEFKDRLKFLEIELRKCQQRM